MELFPGPIQETGECCVRPADALFVLDKRVRRTLATLAEACSGDNRTSALDQKLGEFDAADRLTVRDRRPGEHRGAGGGTCHPAGELSTARRAAPIGLAQSRDAIVGPFSAAVAATWTGVNAP